MQNRVWPQRAKAFLAGFLLALAASVASPHASAQGNLPPDRTGKQRVVVVPVDLPGRAPVAVDRKEVLQALFGARESVAAHYRAISYGEMDFVGTESDILGPITLAEPADFCGAGHSELAVAAEAELRRRGISPAAYDHIVFLIPSDAPCGWTGLADIGGRRVWVKAATARALQHELGHNLGMDHAVRWQGSGAEGSDFMGSGAASLNAPHVVQIGWLDRFPGKVVEVTGPGDVTLEALEADPRQSALPKVAIVRPAPGANTYFLSYRAAGPANPLPAEFTQGVNIHIADPSRRNGGLTYYVESLSDGAAYADGPMAVRQLSHTDGGRVTFRISFSGAGQAMPAGPPPAPPGTVQSMASGECIDLPRGQTADGTAAIQFDCHGGPNQRWNVAPAGGAAYRIVSELSGKCIGTDPGRGTPGGPIVQSPCGSSPSQRWSLWHVAGGDAFRNEANRLCLDVPGASTAAGTGLIAWTCNGGPNQTWRYVPRGDP